MILLDNDWEFLKKWEDGFLQGAVAGEPVRLPHTAEMLPLHYADHKSYQSICGYRRRLMIPASEKGLRQFLQLDGAAHIATVYVNGKELGTHRCGYTEFRVEITDAVRYGEENTITVKLDTRENAAVPPFGFVIDYLTFGGLYRDVWLDNRPQTYIEDVYPATPDLHSADVQVTMSAPLADAVLRVRILDGEKVLAEKEAPAASGHISLRAADAESWSPESPKLYACVTELIENGTVLDSVRKNIGFRTVTFTENEFLLNGRPCFLRGLNRHQCYPYIGYAASKSLQEEDARILKEELQCNAVRTSHYPQSRWFLDACDRLGLLVFTEIPGWQHIGDAAWKQQAVQNTRDMVLQNRSHPSIFLWGVRINESQDDNDFYKETNAAAHALDPYRSTSGVRYLEKSSLLEDVYSYNDFSHDGTTSGVKAKKDVTPDLKKPLIISESNGHMFPTKAFDPWSKRQEQALRHASVLDGAMADHEHAGCFQWCMFDYPTHRDFGSGDRICYHGVMDSFRNPKTAAALYASQGEDHPVLEIGSPMDIGDYPAGQIGKVYAFSNADQIDLYKNDDFVASFTPKGWNGLKHGPVEIDDLIGCLLETKEGYEHGKAQLIHGCLNDAVKYGASNLPLSTKAKLAFAMMKYKLSYQDGVALFGKYVGNWGGEAVRWRFDAKKDGKVVASILKTSDCHLHLDVKVSNADLAEGDVYDMAAVRIRVQDTNGNLASYAQLPLTLEAQGPVEILGPHTVTAEGGMCGTYIRTTGKAGEASLIIRSEQTAAVVISFHIKGEAHHE